jgi:hypothetical protein
MMLRSGRDQVVLLRCRPRVPFSVAGLDHDQAGCDAVKCSHVIPIGIRGICGGSGSNTAIVGLLLRAVRMSLLVDILVNGPRE